MFHILLQESTLCRQPVYNEKVQDGFDKDSCIDWIGSNVYHVSCVKGNLEK